MSVSRPILRYHGGKWLLAPWIVSQFPAHRVYCEPFGGAGSILLQKPRAYSEAYNDMDDEVVNLFRVARDRGTELVRALALTPFSRVEFELSYIPVSDELEKARRMVVRSMMGFGSACTRPNRDGSTMRTGFRSISNQSGRAPAMDWTNYPPCLLDIVERLQGVVIENREAVDVMARFDGTDTLHYVDPPYVHATRQPDAGGSIRAYRHEMTDAQHRDLAAFLCTLQGAVIVSGYGSDLYDQELFAGWERLEKTGPFADGANERTEVLWLRNVHHDLFRP